MPAAAARGVYFLLQRFRGEPVTAAMRDVRRTEFLPAEELRRLQAERQLEQLRFARRHVPYYEEILAPVADRIERRLSWEEVDAVLESLPVIEKGSPLERPERFRARNIASLKTHPDKTSGSSGTPLVFPCDQDAWAYRHALNFRCMETFGVKVGEPYALVFGLHWNSRTRREISVRDRVLNRTRISAFEIGPAAFDRHIRQLRRARPTHMIGYPAAIASFCALAKERGVDFAWLKLKAVFTTGEPLRSLQREVIEGVTGSRCVDVYGSAEGGLMAYECPEGRMHVCVETTWLTVRGESRDAGEAIVTDMMLRAFPLVRYAMGDEIRFSAEVCPCGRAQPVLEQIEGRTGDAIELSDGRRLDAHIGSYIFKPFAKLGVVRRYRFVQDGGGSITLMIVVTSGFDGSHLELLRRELATVFGREAPEVRIVDDLPPMPNAKHRDFVRLRAS